MGKERNKRSRGEATFLELIKMQIQRLQEDISAIKSIILESSDSYNDVSLPPIPPPPYSYDKTTLLACRDVDIQIESLLPKSVHYDVLNLDGASSASNCYRTIHQGSRDDDETTDLLRSEGHFDVDNCSLTWPTTISLAQQTAKSRRDVLSSSPPLQEFPNTLAENIAGAQEQASALMDAETTGTRMTYEAKEADTERGGPEIPTALSNETLGDYFLAHLDIACSEFPCENRRPYLQQQILKLENRHFLSDEAGKLLLDTMERYAPSCSFSGELRFMCSDCGALFKEQGAKCAVCEGFDIFDVLESRGMGTDWTENCDCESDGTNALSDYEEPASQAKSLMRARSFPDFMQNRNVSSHSESRLRASVDKMPDSSAAHVDYCNDKTYKLGFLDTVQAVYYAVRGGPKPGVYCTFDEVSLACKGSQGAHVKKFTDREAALDFAGTCL